jgi:hypothetical protein
MDIMAQRILLVRLIEVYINDSPLISSLCRLMRKATQNLTLSNSPMLDKEHIHGHGKPREITKQFKVFCN